MNVLLAIIFFIGWMGMVFKIALNPLWVLTENKWTQQTVIEFFAGAGIQILCMFHFIIQVMAITVG